MYYSSVGAWTDAPVTGARTYFEIAVVDQIDSLDRNSKYVMRTQIPNILSTSPIFLFVFIFL